MRYHNFAKASGTWTSEKDLDARHGMEITILRPLRVPEERDEEAGPMYKVRFSDGYEADVFEDELVA